MYSLFRQHKGKFQTVQDAMDTFSSSLESVKEAHVARYLNCVTGMGMMLPDCSMMPWDHGVKVDDIKKYLETSSEMTKLVKAADSVDAFAAHMKDVEGVILFDSESHHHKHPPIPCTDHSNMISGD